MNDRLAEIGEIYNVLSHVADPEIPVLSIVDLGIVRSAGLDRVVLTSTYMGCLATQVIEHDIRSALDRAGYSHISIERSLSPPWTTDRISLAGRAKLQAYGIAPPKRSAATCPKCSSDKATEVSKFGSTPCKALWRCDDCSEPFELFKCH